MDTTALLETARPWLFVAYGVFKVIVGSVSIVSHRAALALDKVPIVTAFVTPDRTPAGLMTEALITLFGFFTMAEGLSSILKLHGLHQTLASPWSQIRVATVFGLLFLAVSSAAISEARKKGSKFSSREHIQAYWQGIGWGLFFLLFTVPLVITLGIKDWVVVILSIVGYLTLSLTFTPPKE